MATSNPLAHSITEDVLAYAIGTLFVALGLALLKESGLGVGGTAGIAYLAFMTSGWSFSLVFFLVNIPFFAFAYLTFGAAYLARSVAVTVLLSVETAFLPPLLSFEHVEPAFAAVLGGLLIGMGLLALIRHRTGLGGFGTMAVYFQERFGWRAGKVLMAADSLVVAAALALMEPRKVLLSILGAVCINLVLALYHKPGRYTGA